MKISFLSLTLFALGTAASVVPLQKRATPKLVFAHFMVGILGTTYTLQDWVNDINLAKATGIDAFALNIGTDSFTDTQLSLAYTAANANGFKLFISFDFAASPGFGTNFQTEVVPRLQTYAPNGANVVWNNKALVSTFSGDGFDWSGVRSAVSTQLEIIPFYQAANINPSIDGLFNWQAWPSANNQPVNTPMNTSADVFYKSQLNGKPYMMNVSPWFYTHYSPQSFNKNFLFKSDTLLIDRLNQVLQIQPDLLEIATWNDYGESHYIGPLHEDRPQLYSPASNGESAASWVSGFPHDAWRDIIKPYIAAYKNGGAVQISSFEIVYWYRPFPKAISCSDPRLGPPTGSNIPDDAVWAAVLAPTAGTVLTISVGGFSSNFTVPAGVNYFEGNFAAGQPSFTLKQNGNTILSGTASKAIQTSNCPSYNFNAFVGKIPA
ncbi:glycoside hydrolase [Exidia glandulosa HHB12029]|uniref:Glycoside hydrolase n=1 Tax=Exidia glandulosa HHB12029 TaxID=1314781 RepID=A0A165QBE2_EXIGL|nr:glycoside hydrolase [Exidia glandulosa HHB12029]